MIEAEFAAAVAPFRSGLRLHCYRMLGSSHDSDDMVQETMLRAWKSRDALEDPTRLRAWLYRIATNACLDELATRPRRLLAEDVRPAAAGDLPAAAPLDDIGWLEPMPDTWLAGADDPATRYTLRESVALAFVAALQVLSPAQRAALLLRDVIGLSADETATALAQSIDATHSALHRARQAIEAKVADAGTYATAPTDQAVLAQYVRAIADSDVDAMIALVHADMHTTMPPSPTWIAGYTDNALFYRAMFARWAINDVRATPIGVNGGYGFLFERGGVVRAIEAVELRDGKFFRLHHFMQPALVQSSIFSHH